MPRNLQSALSHNLDEVLIGQCDKCTTDPTTEGHGSRGPALDVVGCKLVVQHGRGKLGTRLSPGSEKKWKHGGRDIREGLRWR